MYTDVGGVQVYTPLDSSYIMGTTTNKPNNYNNSNISDSGIFIGVISIFIFTTVLLVTMITITKR